MTIPTLISDGERIAGIDHITNVLEVIDYPHKEIHGGTAYRAHVTEDVTANTFANMVWLTPNSSVQMHMLVSVMSQNAAHAYFYELAEVPDTGAAIAVTPRNANRNYVDNSNAQQMWANATINTAGSILLGDVVLGSAFRKSDGVGGALSLRGETPLRRNTWYTVHIDEDSEEDQWMSIFLDWYEHAPKTA